MRNPSFVPALLALAMLAAAPLSAMAQKAEAPPAATMDTAVGTAPGKGVATQVMKTSATIVAIDPATRDVTLKRQDGKVITIGLSEEVRNFDQLKIGDKVHVEYAQALALELKKGGGGTPAITGGDAIKRSEPGQKPGGQATRQVAVLADVVGVDKKHRILTLKGPGGNIVEMIVEDPEQLKHIKKGDQVQALYTESVAIKVEAAAK
jgi:Cu/Ag efflux protein CusF